MYKVLSIVALGLLATACVPHDPDEPDFYQQTETYLEPVRVEPAKPAPQPVVVRPVVQQAPAQPVVVEAPQPTWWQQNKQKHVIKTVVPTCPCKDPNDPCTHCYQK